MKIPVNIKWENNNIICLCIKKCDNCNKCEEDVVIHDPYIDIEKVMDARKYKKEKGRYRQYG